MCAIMGVGCHLIASDPHDFDARDAGTSSLLAITPAFRSVANRRGQEVAVPRWEPAQARRASGYIWDKLSVGQ